MFEVNKQIFIISNDVSNEEALIDHIVSKVLDDDHTFMSSIEQEMRLKMFFFHS